MLPFLRRIEVCHYWNSVIIIILWKALIRYSWKCFDSTNCFAGYFSRIVIWNDYFGVAFNLQSSGSRRRLLPIPAWNLKWSFLNYLSQINLLNGNWFRLCDLIVPLKVCHSHVARFLNRLLSSIWLSRRRRSTPWNERRSLILQGSHLLSCISTLGIRQILVVNTSLFRNRIEWSNGIHHCLWNLLFNLRRLILTRRHRSKVVLVQADYTLYQVIPTIMRLKLRPSLHLIHFGSISFRFFFLQVQLGPQRLVAISQGVAIIQIIWIELLDIWRVVVIICHRLVTATLDLGNALGFGVVFGFQVVMLQVTVVRYDGIFGFNFDLCCPEFLPWQRRFTK